MLQLLKTVDPTIKRLMVEVPISIENDSEILHSSEQVVKRILEKRSQKLRISKGVFSRKIMQQSRNAAYKRNEQILLVSKDAIFEVLKILKYHTNYQFKVLADLTAVDYPESKYRFEVVYNLLSVVNFLVSTILYIIPFFK